MLERRHDVLAPTLPGHAGGPPLTGELSDALLADAVERAMDEAGFATAHIAGNSLGGFVALQLAARGRAESVVALAPTGGWAAGDGSFKDRPPHPTRRRSWPPPSPDVGRPSRSARASSTFPQADWVELDGVGHCPQLDVPLETAELIYGFTAC